MFHADSQTTTTTCTPPNAHHPPEEKEEERNNRRRHIILHFVLGDFVNELRSSKLSVTLSRSHRNEWEKKRSKKARRRGEN